MNDDPMDSIPSFNRVSIRAVLVTDGQDVRAALAKAGIVDPVALHVVMGDDLDQSGGFLGNGITPNLTGVLETEHEDDFDLLSDHALSATSANPASEQQPDAPVVTMLPAAYGLRPLAPVVRKQGT
jgi:hypothetical protein